MARTGVRIHWSWAPALGVLVWTLAADHFPAAGVAGTGSLVAALAVAVGAFLSVLARAILRRLAASSAGVEPTDATLWPAGAVAPTPSATSPVADVRMLGAGLLTSLALAAAFAAASRSAGQLTLAEAADVLSRFNAAYGIFNLIPALPLDGGVFARSRLIARGASPARATATFARAGICFGVLLVVVGALRTAAGDTSGGVGIAVAGLVFAGAARAHLQGVARAAAGGGIARRLLAGTALGIAMVVPAATLYHPPLSVVAPGEPLDVLEGVAIRGVPTSRITGRYFAASVKISNPTALHAFVALFRSGTHLVRRSKLPPVIEDPFRERGSGASFEGARVFAAAAAARAVGLDVTVRGTGARILVAGTHAAAAGLLVGDVIVAVDGRPVATLLDLRDAITSRPAGTEFTLGVDRAGRRFETRIASRHEERSGGVPGINADLETRDLRVQLPFEITFGNTEGAGPSGGLAYAIAFTDLLDPRDLAASRTIAATGVLHLTGQADPIIGAIAKIGSALDAGADLFFVSAGDARLISRGPIPVVGVRSLREAVARLTASR